MGLFDGFKKKAERGGEDIVLRVEGMTCGGCVNSVTRALQGVAGVQSASVSLDEKKAVVRAADVAALREALLRAVTEAGFTATVVNA